MHAICDRHGRPLNLIVTAGQVSDYIGARALLSSLPNVDWLLGDRGYDADWFREALKDKGIRACFPGRKQRKKTVKYDKRRYKRRNRSEIMFGKLKDWRRVATRYDRCPKVFLSAIALAALVIYWLWVLTLMPVQRCERHSPPPCRRSPSKPIAMRCGVSPIPPKGLILRGSPCPFC